MGGVVVEMEWYLKFEFVLPIFYCKKLANAYSNHKIPKLWRFMFYLTMYFTNVLQLPIYLNDLL